MPAIHATAIVDPDAQLADDVEVGPYCVIGPKVKIGAGTRFVSHVRVEGPSTIGSGNIFYPFGNIGAAPQDLKYKGEDSELIVGDNNKIRECVTLNRGTTGGGMVTKIGNGCLLMAYAHVGHDSIIHDNVILANSVAVAGHVIVQEGASVGGLCGITQFNVIGKMAYIGGCSLIHKDVAPFVTALGNPVAPRGINKVGLERKGFSEAAVRELIKLYKIIFMKGLTVREAETEARASCDLTLPEPAYFLDFVLASKNGVAR